MNKICRDCGLTFYKTWSYGGNQCRPCNRASQRQLRAADPDTARLKDRIYYNTTERKAIRSEQGLLERYGLSVETRDALLESQGSCCAICSTPAPTTKKGWNVDLNHDTGVVRGILCQHCNTLLGMCKENVGTLLNAITYLEKDLSHKPLRLVS